MSEELNIAREPGKEQLKIPQEKDAETVDDISNKSEISNMEVHHHPEVEKKSFKEYLLEGLMIFLAVSMGFIAENIRENISENSKAKELSESLYEEVYTDSVHMQQVTTLRLQKEDHMNDFRKYTLDSSLTELSANFSADFVWSYLLTTSIMFEPNDGIMNQLRNSGALRYFKNIELQNAISRLNVSIQNTRNRNSQEYNYVDLFVRPVALKHFDFQWWDTYTQNGKMSLLEAIRQKDFRQTRKPVIKNLPGFNREEIEGATAYYLLIVRATRQIYYKNYIESNHQLLEALRKEYHFKNE